MSVYVNVNGVQQRGLDGVNIARFQVSQSLSNRNTAELVILVTDGATSYAEGQQVDLGNGAARYFVGTIAVLASRWLNPRQPVAVVEHTLSCVSFDQIASRRIVTIPQSYTDRSAGYIVRDIATQFLGGENVGVGGVEDGPTFATFTIESGASVYEVFDSIAEQSGMYWDILGVLASPELRLYARGSLVSGWSIGVTSPIVIGGPGGEAGISVVTDRQGLANEVWVEVSEGPGDRTVQDFLGNGSEREFSVDNPIDSHPVIRVDGFEKTVAVENYIAADWYWNPGSPTVKQHPSQPILTGANLLSVEYVPRIRVLLSHPSGLASDGANIAARAALEVTSGRYQAVIAAGDGATIANATTAAQAYLAAHKIPAKKLTIRSFDAQAESLGIGMTVPVNLPVLGVNSTFLVESVTRSWEGRMVSDGSDAVLHAHTLSTGAVIGDWTTLFASAWSVGGAASVTGGAAVSNGSRVVVQDLGVLDADATVTPSPNSPATGDLLFVTWEFGTTAYALTWGAGFVGTSKAEYRPRTPSKHVFPFIFINDNWVLLPWRTDY